MAEKEDNELSELARRLAAQRQIVEGNCEMCGKAFTGTRKRKYCSHACTQRAYYARTNPKPEKTRSEIEGETPQ